MLGDVGVLNLLGIAPTHLEARNFGIEYNKKLFNMSSMMEKKLNLKSHSLNVRTFPFVKTSCGSKYIDSKKYLEAVGDIVIKEEGFKALLKEICENFEFQTYLSDATDNALILFEGHEVSGMVCGVVVLIVLKVCMFCVE